MFKNEDEHKKLIGHAPGAPGYFMGNTIYMVLDNLHDKDTAVFLTTHEIGHQLLDPGSMFIVAAMHAVIAKRISHPHQLIGGAQNTYSDAVVNCINWEDDAYNRLYPGAVERTILRCYFNAPRSAWEADTRNDPNGVLRRGLINGMMALEYVKIHDPAGFPAVRAKLTGNYKKFYDTLDLLIKERNLGPRDVQKYYDVAIPLLELMNELFRGGADDGGVFHL